MRIDATTLADLEVFGRDGAGGLFDLIDRTKTVRGRTALWRRLQAPPTDLASILATQDAVRFLRDQPGLREFDRSGIMAVERYVRSNIAIAP
jgi:DNA mismatch repair ATPase MutS